MPFTSFTPFAWVSKILCTGAKFRRSNAGDRGGFDVDWNSRPPGRAWNYWRVKNGKLDVPEVQREIAADWIGLYQHVFRK
jgi:hypothetical protein